MTTRGSALAVLLVLCLGAPSTAQQRSIQGEIRGQADRVRGLYLGLDYHGAYHAGAKWRRTLGSESTAWWLMAAARADHLDEAIAAAESLTVSAPDDPWSWAALAGVLVQTQGRENEAQQASLKTLELPPGHHDLQLIHAETSVHTGKYQDAVDFVDEGGGAAPSAELLVSKARGLYYTALSARARAGGYQGHGRVAGLRAPSGDGPMRFVS